MIYTFLAMPYVINMCTVTARKKHAIYAESLVSQKISQFDQKTRDYLRTKRAEMSEFMEQLEKVLQMKYSSQEIEIITQRVNNIFSDKSKEPTLGFQQVISNMNVSVPVEVKLDFNKLSNENITKNVNENENEEAIRQYVSQYVSENLSANIQKLRGEIKNDIWHKETSTAAPIHENNIHVELDVLSTVEQMVEAENYDEALKILKWRKRIINISNQCGPTIAGYIQSLTQRSKIISHTDFFQAYEMGNYEEREKDSEDSRKYETKNISELANCTTSSPFKQKKALTTLLGRMNTDDHLDGRKKKRGNFSTFKKLDEMNSAGQRLEEFQSLFKKMDSAHKIYMTVSQLKHVRSTVMDLEKE